MDHLPSPNDPSTEEEDDRLSLRTHVEEEDASPSEDPNHTNEQVDPLPKNPDDLTMEEAMNPLYYEYPMSESDIFLDFKKRHAGLLKALTDEAESLTKFCDDHDMTFNEKKNLSLFGLQNEKWVLREPFEEVPPPLPEPCVGINCRGAMKKEDWLKFVAMQSDWWLVAVAWVHSANSGFNSNARKKLFDKICIKSTLLEELIKKEAPSTKKKNQKIKIATKRGQQPKISQPPKGKKPKPNSPKVVGSSDSIIVSNGEEKGADKHKAVDGEATQAVNEEDKAKTKKPAQIKIGGKPFRQSTKEQKPNQNHEAIQSKKKLLAVNNVGQTSDHHITSEEETEVYEEVDHEVPGKTDDDQCKGCKEEVVKLGEYDDAGGKTMGIQCHYCRRKYHAKCEGMKRIRTPYKCKTCKKREKPTQVRKKHENRTSK